jgi:hypothetical protein
MLKCECQTADANYGQKNLKKIFFLCFHISVHQLTQNCKANRLICNVYKFFLYSFSIIKKKRFEPQEDRISRFSIPKREVQYAAKNLKMKTSVELANLFISEFSASS